MGPILLLALDKHFTFISVLCVVLYSAHGGEAAVNSLSITWALTSPSACLVKPN